MKCANCKKLEATQKSKKVNHGLIILCDKCASEEGGVDDIVSFLKGFKK